MPPDPPSGIHTQLLQVCPPPQNEIASYTYDLGTHFIVWKFSLHMKYESYVWTEG